MNQKYKKIFKPKSKKEISEAINKMDLCEFLEKVKDIKGCKVGFKRRCQFFMYKSGPNISIVALITYFFITIVGLVFTAFFEEHVILYKIGEIVIIGMVVILLFIVTPIILWMSEISSKIRIYKLNRNFYL